MDITIASNSMVRLQHFHWLTDASRVFGEITSNAYPQTNRTHGKTLIFKLAPQISCVHGANKWASLNCNSNALIQSHKRSSPNPCMKRKPLHQLFAIVLWSYVYSTLPNRRSWSQIWIKTGNFTLKLKWIENSKTNKKKTIKKVFGSYLYASTAQHVPWNENNSLTLCDLE